MAEGSRIRIRASAMQIKSEDTEEGAVENTGEEEIEEEMESEELETPEEGKEEKPEADLEESPEPTQTGEELVEEVRVFTKNVEKMSTERAARILSDALEGKIDRNKISTAAPLAPKGGEVYLVDLSIIGSRKEALQDGFYWRHDGNKKYPKLIRGKQKDSPKKKTNSNFQFTIVKSIFKVRDSRVQRGFSNTFQRHAYRPEEDDRFILIHYMGHEEDCEADALKGVKSLAKTLKIRTVHVPKHRLPSSCFNCLCPSDTSTTKHGGHLRLGRKLYTKTMDSIPKPDMTILEAIEDIMEGVLSMSTLKKHVHHQICHECMLVLRQAINRKLEAEASLQDLHSRIDKITNLDRRKYYRENYSTDKSGRCWGCMFEFSKCDDKAKLKYGRHSLSMSLIAGMTVMEGIETMLEDEAESLFGLSPTRLFICKLCYQLMRMVVRAQCSFDNLQSNFTDRTHPKSIMAELQGIVAYSDDEVNVRPPPLMNDSDLDDLDEEFEIEEENIGEEEEDEEEDLEEEEEMEDEGETDSDDNMGAAGRKRAGDSLIGSPDIKRAKADGSEVTGAGPDEVIVTTEDDGRITVKLTAIKHKGGTGGATPVQVKLESKAGLTNLEDQSKTSTRRTPLDRWELQYDDASSAQAGLVRLVLEVTGVKYCDVDDDNEDNEGTSLPYPALPVIRKGDLEISHATVICRYLGEEYGLAPESQEDKLLADQVVQFCHDYWTEGHFVSSDNYQTSEEGKELCVKKFVSERVPVWLSFFEQCLKRNMEGKGFLFGNVITYADLALYHVLQSTQYKFPAVYASADFIPLLKAYSLRLGTMDRIKRYHKSPAYKGVSSYLF